jgi:L-phenylalanine/L-methionine N-acetyltransferase
MNAEPAIHPPGPTDDIVIRAARPIDCEGIAALENMPGYRWGTLRLPYQSPEEIRKRLEGNGPNNVSLVVAKNGRIIGLGGFERLPGRRSPMRPISAWVCMTTFTAKASVRGFCAKSS